MKAYNGQQRSGRTIEIDLPPGNYIPTFTRLGREPQDRAEVSAQVFAPTEPVSERRLDRRRSLLGLGLLGACAAAAIFFSPRTPTLSGRPILRVEISSADASDGRAAALRSVFEEAVLEQETVMLLDANTSTPVSPRIAVARSSYTLQIILQSEAIRWRLARPDSGEVAASGEEGLRGGAPAELAQLGRKTAIAVAGVGGPIQTSELAIWSADDLGYICVLRAEMAMASRSTSALGSSARCLERTLERREESADAHAALATTYMFLNRLSGDAPQQQSMLAHANRAVELAPTSARAALSQMSAYYQANRTEEAVSAARRAIALGAANPETLGKASLVIYLSGRWEEGTKVAERATSSAGVYKPVGASLVRMLEAYRTGDFRAAVRRVDEAARPDPVATLVKLAALRRLEAEDELKSAVAKARSQYPDFDKMLLSVANSGRYEKSLASSLGTPLTEIADQLLRTETAPAQQSSH